MARASLTTKATKANTGSSAAKKEPFNIFLVGDLGAGKATQSAFLKKEFSLYEFDFGLEQARLRKRDSRLDALLKRTADIGKLTPTRVYRQVVSAAIERVLLKQGMLFDGGPRMPGEVRMVSRLLKEHRRSRSICIYLTVAKKEAIRRIINRPGYFGRGKRVDDSLEAINNRFKYVQTSVRKARDVYKKLYPYATVSGMGTVEEVHERVLKAIERLTKKLN